MFTSCPANVNFKLENRYSSSLLVCAMRSASPYLVSSAFNTQSSNLQSASNCCVDVGTDQSASNCCVDVGTDLDSYCNLPSTIKLCSNHRLIFIIFIGFNAFIYSIGFVKFSYRFPNHLSPVQYQIRLLERLYQVLYPRELSSTEALDNVSRLCLLFSASWQYQQ